MLAILRWCRRGRCWRSLREPTEATLSAREAGVEHPLVEFYGVGQAPLLSPPGARQQLRDIIVYCQGQIVVVWSPVVGLEEAASGPKPRNVLSQIHNKKEVLNDYFYLYCLWLPWYKRWWLRIHVEHAWIVIGNLISLWHLFTLTTSFKDLFSYTRTCSHHDF